MDRPSRLPRLLCLAAWCTVLLALAGVLAAIGRSVPPLPLDARELGAKDEEAVLLIVGDGPETPTPAEVK